MYLFLSYLISLGWMVTLGIRSTPLLKVVAGVLGVSAYLGVSNGVSIQTRCRYFFTCKPSGTI
jgi:hypothetical protein